MNVAHALKVARLRVIPLKMADYRRPQIYAQLRRWDDLNDRWMDHFGRQDALVEIFVNRGRVVLSCRGQNYQQPVSIRVNDVTI